MRQARKALVNKLGQLADGRFGTSDGMSVSVATFDSSIEWLCKNQSPSIALESFRSARVVATGGTALYDSVIEVIDVHVEISNAFLKILCITDGADNRSEATREDIDAAIKANDLEQNKEDGLMQFVFISEDEKAPESLKSVANLYGSGNSAENLACVTAQDDGSMLSDKTGQALAFLTSPKK